MTNSTDVHYSTTTFKDNGEPILLNADGTRSIFCDVADGEEGDDVVAEPEVAVLTKVVEYSQTAAALTDLRARFDNVIFQVDTTKGMADAVAARAELRNLRVGLERMRKDIKGPALERCRLIDAEAKDITAKLTALEDPIDGQIQAETAKKAREKAERERIEAERKANIRARIELIRAIPAGMAGERSMVIAMEILELEKFEPLFADFAEQAEDASVAAEQAVTALKAMHLKAVEQETEAQRQADLAELNRLAALDLQRQRDELAADAKRLADEKAARDLAEATARATEQRRIDDDNARVQAELKAGADKLALERAEFDAKLQAQAEAAAQRQRGIDEAAAAKIEADRVAALPVEVVVAALDGAEGQAHLLAMVECESSTVLDAETVAIDARTVAHKLIGQAIAHAETDRLVVECLHLVIGDLLAAGYLPDAIRALVEVELANQAGA